MSKLLPYFRWYPADAETDANFRAMSDAEIGFYIRCLNHAWINGGIPADSCERARVLRTRRDTADKYWLRVGKCFVTSENDPQLLVNPRAETERRLAMSKSIKATESVNTRYERSTNVETRAYGSVSVSESSFEVKKENDEEFLLTADPPSVVRPHAPAGPGFDDWWKVYWNKTAKAEAQKAWKQCAHHHGAQFLIDQCIADRKRFEGTPQWEWRVNLHPATWLRGRRWEDQLPPSGVQRQNGPRAPTSTGERVLAKMAQRIANGENPL